MSTQGLPIQTRSTCPFHQPVWAVGAGFLLESPQMIRAAAFILCSLLAFGSAQGSPIKYDLIPRTLPIGFELTGSITTDGTLGTLTTTNIVAWEWAVTDGNIGTSANSTAGTISFLEDLNATAQTLELVTLTNGLTLHSTTTNVDLQFLWAQFHAVTQLTGNLVGLSAVGRYDVLLVGNGFPIATVPEPSSLVLAAIALALVCVIYLVDRSRAENRSGELG